MTQFKVKSKYFCTCMCDDIEIQEVYTVEYRTTHTVILSGYFHKALTKRFKIHEGTSSEYVAFGRWAHAPTLYASNEFLG
jgi:hypothetical protein